MSGRGPSDKEVTHICDTVEEIKSIHPQLKICACLGLTNEEQAERLKNAGVDRYNHNLNTTSLSLGPRPLITMQYVPI
jgi:biotin synthase